MALAAILGVTAPPDVASCIDRLANTHRFSGVVSVRHPKATTVRVEGILGGEGSAPIAADTRFNLGSASKMFTAVAVAQLIDAGKIRLDDPIGRSVGGLTPEAAAATVRQLLTHTSGLGSFFSPENLPAITRAHNVAELLPLVAGERPAFPPGSRFQYSNTGFLLLGALVERVTGSSYDDYLREHVFKPAGMTTTGLDPGPAANQASGMTSMTPHLRPSPNGPPQSPAQGPLQPSPAAAMRGNPAGGAFSTAADVQRFFAALVAHKLTSAAMLEKLTSPASPAQPVNGAKPGPQYGMGFGVGTFEGHRWFGHNGGAPGVNAEAVAFPDDGVVAVVLANRDPPLASALFRELRPLLFDPAAMKACARAGAQTN
jgi:CubicO group peptidase (beta-lactamase class C family)